jgi:hypothetical protein
MEYPLIDLKMVQQNGESHKRRDCLQIIRFAARLFERSFTNTAVAAARKIARPVAMSQGVSMTMSPV